MHEAFAQPCSYPPPIGAGNGTERGFTLIEISIVLVVVGLIVGGVLVGRDLIAAAAVRAQISQIEKYQQAVNTFRVKYGYLPGDIKDPEATQFGFVARGPYQGQGDGNGIIEGNLNDALSFSGFYSTAGEPLLFWKDLGIAGLIALNSALPAYSTIVNLPVTALPYYIPQGAIGRGNYIYIWSGTSFMASYNFFGLSAVSSLGVTWNWSLVSTPALTVNEAYSIDSKIDDGLPQSGNAVATYEAFQLITGHNVWAAGGGGQGANVSDMPTFGAVTGSATTCYDNNANNNSPQRYSITQNNGTGVNCALSFKFQ